MRRPTTKSRQTHTSPNPAPCCCVSIHTISHHQYQSNCRHDHLGVLLLPPTRQIYWDTIGCNSIHAARCPALDWATMLLGHHHPHHRSLVHHIHITHLHNAKEWCLWRRSHWTRMLRQPSLLVVPYLPRSNHYTTGILLLPSTCHQHAALLNPPHRYQCRSTLLHCNDHRSIGGVSSLRHLHLLTACSRHHGTFMCSRGLGRHPPTWLLVEQRNARLPSLPSSQNPSCIISPTTSYPAVPSCYFPTKMYHYSNGSRFPCLLFVPPGSIPSLVPTHPYSLLASSLCKVTGATSQSHTHWKRGGVTCATGNLRLPPIHTSKGKDVD